jgi:hypothetical protein
MSAPGVPAWPLKVRDCSHAVPGVSVGSRRLPTVSLTVMVQLGANTQLIAGALTSTILSDCACAANGNIASAANAPNIMLRPGIVFSPQSECGRTGGV